MAIIDDKVKRFLEAHPTFVGDYVQGIDALYRSGIMDFLRENGRTISVNPSVPNYEAFKNSLYDFSVGYNVAIDDMFYFLERFINVQKAPELPQMDFNGAELALQKGDLTKEELDGIK